MVSRLGYQHMGIAYPEDDSAGSESGKNKKKNRTDDTALRDEDCSDTETGEGQQETLF